MNIRDFIFINKAKNVNKIRILDILGFESNTFISQTPETIKTFVDEETTEIDETTEYIQDKADLKQDTSNNIFDKSNLLENASTETFQPIKVTSKIKKIWTDIETRRTWVVPSVLIFSTLILITSVTTIFISSRNSSREVEILYKTLTIDSNNLINELPNIINISTDNFYSKYDVSNSSANLQIIESTIMEYDRNLSNREGFTNNDELSLNLNNIFILIDDLDDLISYRILRSEILIYNDTLIINDKLDIDALSNQLSEISAKSKRNYENLPKIYEFENHYLLLEETLISAEDLHGRLIAALRNNEYELANSLIVAININKEIETSSFDRSLLDFKVNKTNVYNDIKKLP
tara:strand:- start:5543 stop:6592 length:1050 start_codon:yes stop_codon:yes gene_type:complete